MIIVLGLYNIEISVDSQLRIMYNFGVAVWQNGLRIIPCLQSTSPMEL